MKPEVRKFIEEMEESKEYVTFKRQLRETKQSEI